MAVYRVLGCEQLERHYRRDAFDVAFLGAGADVLLEFQGPPLPDESVEYVRRNGWSIERVAFSCDDVVSAYRELISSGVRSAWPPTPFMVDEVTWATTAGVWSPEGLMIDLVQPIDVSVPSPQRGERGDLALHHVCCLTDDLARAQHFWATHFGLRTLYDFTAPLSPRAQSDRNTQHCQSVHHDRYARHGQHDQSAQPDCHDQSGGTKGFVLLGDAYFDSTTHEFTLEIIGGEHDAIDGPVFERRGPCFDHICFTTSDVAEVWGRAVEVGVEPLSPPTYYPEYDATIGWLYDTDGTHIELMSTLPAEVLETPHMQGRCSNHWVDNWQRNPEVLPRGGSSPVR